VSEQATKNNVYITEQNDTWDLIAFKCLGDESFTPNLFKANLELTRIVLFPPNVAIIIPEIEIERTGDEPPWAR